MTVIIHYHAIFSLQIPALKKRQLLFLGLQMAWIVCRVGFLPCHNVCQASSYDGRSVQVVAMLADSESPQQRQFSRSNLGACHATIIDTITSAGHEAQAVNEGTTGHEAQAVNEGTTSGFANVVKKTSGRFNVLLGYS
jgi:hypothetical protein